MRKYLLFCLFLTSFVFGQDLTWVPSTATGVSFSDCAKIKALPVVSSDFTCRFIENYRKLVGNDIETSKILTISFKDKNATIIGDSLNTASLGAKIARTRVKEINGVRVHYINDRTCVAIPESGVVIVARDANLISSIALTRSGKLAPLSASSPIISSANIANPISIAISKESLSSSDDAILSRLPMPNFLTINLKPNNKSAVFEIRGKYSPNDVNSVKPILSSIKTLLYSRYYFTDKDLAEAILDGKIRQSGNDFVVTISLNDAAFASFSKHFIK